MAATSTTTQKDQDIQQDVLDELEWDPQIEPNELDVSVKDGVVTLTGWVDTYLKRMAAQDAAHRVRAVKAVANEIEVRLHSTAERSDEEIAAAAFHALKWDVGLPIDKIDITVSKGWVTLQGEVFWQYQKRDAEQIVHRLAGVKGVGNLIVVKSDLSPSEIRRKIEAALVRSATTDAERIKVEVQGSKVVLKGTVRSHAEKQEAERAAWSARGVTSVDDRITITY